MGVANLDEARRRLAARGAAASEALAPIEALAAERRQLIQSSETQRAEHAGVGADEELKARSRRSFARA